MNNYCPVFSPCRCFPSGSHCSLGPQPSSRAILCFFCLPTWQVSLSSSVICVLTSPLQSLFHFQTLLCDIWLIVVILLYIRAEIWSNLKFQGLTLMSILTHLNISIKDTGLSFWIKAAQLGFFNPSQNVKHKMLPKMLGLCVMEQMDGCQCRFYLMFLL